MLINSYVLDRGWSGGNHPSPAIDMTIRLPRWSVTGPIVTIVAATSSSIQRRSAVAVIFSPSSRRMS